MNRTATFTKEPTHRAYFVKGEGEAARWLELGNVFSHQDGRGFELLLDTLPVGGFNGRITVRVNESSRAGEVDTEQTSRLAMAGRAFTAR